MKLRISLSSCLTLKQFENQFSPMLSGYLTQASHCPELYHFDQTQIGSPCLHSPDQNRNIHILMVDKEQEQSSKRRPTRSSLFGPLAMVDRSGGKKEHFLTLGGWATVHGGQGSPPPPMTALCPWKCLCGTVTGRAVAFRTPLGRLPPPPS